jgi:hypothetical protein
MLRGSAELGVPWIHRAAGRRFGCRLSWASAGPLDAHIPHTELEQVKLIKLEPLEDVWVTDGLWKANLVP